MLIIKDSNFLSSNNHSNVKMRNMIVDDDTPVKYEAIILLKRY
jgi:hypothetical protein